MKFNNEYERVFLEKLGDRPYNQLTAYIVITDMFFDIAREYKTKNIYNCNSKMDFIARELMENINMANNNSVQQAICNSLVEFIYIHHCSYKSLAKWIVIVQEIETMMECLAEARIKYNNDPEKVISTLTSYVNILTKNYILRY